MSDTVFQPGGKAERSPIASNKTSSQYNESRDAFDLVIAFALWPLIMGLCLLAQTWVMRQEHSFLAFNAVYLTLAVGLYFLERARPFEQTWLPPDGQVLTDLTHTLFNKSCVQVIVVMAAVYGGVDALARAPGAIWPSNWPLAFQIILALILVEAGLYAAHRLSHEVRFFWRFHAVHHSAPRLTVINTGRFHVVDTAVSILLGLPILFAMGAPMEIFKWFSAITAFIGLLTHCNVDMRFGPISWVFNTPELHRWHHSKDLREGNKNYGENLVIWDQLFGTYYRGTYRPPATIGIKEDMPKNFLGQCVQPFRKDWLLQKDWK